MIPPGLGSSVADTGVGLSALPPASQKIGIWEPPLPSPPWRCVAEIDVRTSLSLSELLCKKEAITVAELPSWDGHIPPNPR